MSIKIIDGTGSGNEVEVTANNQLSIVGEQHSLQFHHSFHSSNAYQVIGDFTSINNSTHTILHIKNISTTKIIAITYIRIQGLDFTGGTALPSVLTYFQLGMGTTYTSGGTVVTPVNVNFASGQTAEATVYDNSPTVGGTFTEIDKWFIESDAAQLIYNKEGSVILGQNDTFEIRVTSNHTVGVAIARISFVFLSNGN